VGLPRELPGLDDMSRISMGAADNNMNEDLPPKESIKIESKPPPATSEWKPISIQKK
jgi:hypothetical protein